MYKFARPENTPEQIKMYKLYFLLVRIFLLHIRASHLNAQFLQAIDQST